MSSEQIKQLAGQVANGASTLRSKNNAANNGAVRAGGSWKGEAGAAFADAWKKNQAKVVRVLNDMSSLKTRLDTLALRVRQAETEKIASAKKG
ncbi:MAG: WXG100 family type VII secretion target [Defluviitaleaceae bacterium]|nr:WXG100 family type VII secretion target [Defluviitaleaceae bacterium]